MPSQEYDAKRLNKNNQTMTTTQWFLYLYNSYRINT